MIHVKRFLAGLALLAMAGPLVALYIAFPYGMAVATVICVAFATVYLFGLALLPADKRDDGMEVDQWP